MDEMPEHIEVMIAIWELSWSVHKARSHCSE